MSFDLSDRQPYKITPALYDMLNEEYAGFCRHCRIVTMDCGVEPDARRIKCPECGKPAVYGIEEAHLMAWIQVDPYGADV